MHAGLKDATAVSQALITSAGLISVFINLFKRNPIHPDRPLIDFRAALALTPVVLVRELECDPWKQKQVPDLSRVCFAADHELRCALPSSAAPHAYPCAVLSRVNALYAADGCGSWRASQRDPARHNHHLHAACAHGAHDAADDHQGDAWTRLRLTAAATYVSPAGTITLLTP
jgi:hypothetical protein